MTRHGKEVAAGWSTTPSNWLTDRLVEAASGATTSAADVRSIEICRESFAPIRNYPNDDSKKLSACENSANEENKENAETERPWDPRFPKGLLRLLPDSRSLAAWKHRATDIVARRSLMRGASYNCQLAELDSRYTLQYKRPDVEALLSGKDLESPRPLLGLGCGIISQSSHGPSVIRETDLHDSGCTDAMINSNYSFAKPTRNPIAVPCPKDLKRMPKYHITCLLLTTAVIVLLVCLVLNLVENNGTWSGTATFQTVWLAIFWGAYWIDVFTCSTAHLLALLPCCPDVKELVRRIVDSKPIVTHGVSVWRMFWSCDGVAIDCSDTLPVKESQYDGAVILTIALKYGALDLDTEEAARELQERLKNSCSWRQDTYADFFQIVTLPGFPVAGHRSDAVAGLSIPPLLCRLDSCVAESRKSVRFMTYPVYLTASFFLLSWVYRIIWASPWYIQRCTWEVRKMVTVHAYDSEFTISRYLTKQDSSPMAGERTDRARSNTTTTLKIGEPPTLKSCETFS